jgi:hypothetical protein
VNGLEFSHLLLIFPLVVTLHMIEEVIWLPAWSLNAGRWHEPVTTKQFALATAVFLFFVYAMTIFAWWRAEAGLYLVLGTAVVLLVNILIPHLGAALALRRYAPGLVTALLFNLPFLSYFLWRAFQDITLSPFYFLLATLIILLAAAILWPMLFRLGGERAPRLISRWFDCILLFFSLVLFIGNNADMG